MQTTFKNHPRPTTHKSLLCLPDEWHFSPEQFYRQDYHIGTLLIQSKPASIYCMWSSFITKVTGHYSWHAYICCLNRCHWSQWNFRKKVL